MKKIVISELASLENKENVAYLFKNFGKKVALNYLDIFDKVIELLEKGLYTGIYDERLNLRKILVVEQIYILYDQVDNDTYLIVSVWNNKRYPYWF